MLQVVAYCKFVRVSWHLHAIFGQLQSYPASILILHMQLATSHGEKRECGQYTTMYSVCQKPEKYAAMHSLGVQHQRQLQSISQSLVLTPKESAPQTPSFVGIQS